VDVANEAVLSQLLSTAGFDAVKLLKKSSTQRVRDTLRANTQEAKDIGLCGVPSYRVYHRTPQGRKANGGVVWGQDESNVVLDLIAGWDEGTSRTVADVGGEHGVQTGPKL
jgi:2-hydroxychromene-2-carboxylate isomerase